MIQDAQGHELPVTQDLSDKYTLAQLAFNQAVLAAGNESDPEQRASGLIQAIIKNQQAHAKSMVESVAALESYILGLHDASEVGTVEYTRPSFNAGGDELFFDDQS